LRGCERRNECQRRKTAGVHGCRHGKSSLGSVF
jgi:hypothetical protein